MIDQIEVRQARADHLLQALRRQRGELEIGVQARRLSSGQESGPAAGPVPLRLLHERMETQVADVQDARLDVHELIGLDFEQTVRAEVREERAPATLALHHHVREGGGSPVADPDPPGLDGIAGAGLQDERAVGIIGHAPKELDRERRTESPQVP